MANRPNHRAVTNLDSLGHSHGRFITANLATSKVVRVVALVAFLIAIAMREFLRPRKRWQTSKGPHWLWAIDSRPDSTAIGGRSPGSFPGDGFHALGDSHSNGLI
jgi:hypothetical protein